MVNDAAYARITTYLAMGVPTQRQQRLAPNKLFYLKNLFQARARPNFLL